MSIPNWKHLPTHLFEYISTYVDTISANGLLVVSCRKTCPIEPYDIIRWIKSAGDLGGITMDIYSMPTIKITDIIHMLYIIYIVRIENLPYNYLSWLKKKNILLDDTFIYMSIVNFNSDKYNECFKSRIDKIIAYYPSFKYTIAACNIYTILLSATREDNTYNIIQWAFTMKCRIYEMNIQFWYVLLEFKRPCTYVYNEFEDRSYTNQYNIIVIKYVLSLIIDNINNNFNYWHTFIPNNYYISELNKYVVYDDELSDLIFEIGKIINRYNIKSDDTQYVLFRFSVSLDPYIRDLYYKL